MKLNIKQASLLCLLFVFDFCSYPHKKVGNRACLPEDNSIVAMLASAPMEYSLPTDIEFSFDILLGEHVAFSSPRKGVLFSKKHGWSLNLKYNFMTVLETDKVLLLNCSSSVRAMKYSLYSWLVLVDKRSGAVLQVNKYKGVITHSFFSKGKLYYITNKSAKVYCIQCE